VLPRDLVRGGERLTTGGELVQSGGEVLVVVERGRRLALAWSPASVSQATAIARVGAGAPW
jgi:hypothetical protein